MQLKVGGKFHLKLNISKRPIANKYREGKMQRTLKRECKVLEVAEREAVGPSTCQRATAGLSASVGDAGIRLQGGPAALLRRMSRCYTWGLCGGGDRGAKGATPDADEMDLTDPS